MPLIVKNLSSMGDEMTIRQIEKEVLTLKPIEKIHLIEKILISLDKPDPEIEKEWIAESEARYSAYKKGQIKAIPLKNIKKRYSK